MPSQSVPAPGAGSDAVAAQNAETTSNDGELPPSRIQSRSAAKIPVSSILYVMESYKATATPVTITMLLSALAANFIRTEESAREREETLTTSYSAVQVDDDASSSQQVGLGLVNGLVIIGVLTVMTFGVVCLYKYRCMWILKGYLVISITFLLGWFGGLLFYEAIQRYELWVTKISFALALYNFTVVGIYSLFYGKGVPVYVGQGYLIVVSVILAWELSSFSEIAAWILLVLLALYDLYAVLTPCGPLKALVNLMGQDGAQEIPALLYSAQLPPEARRQPRQRQQQAQTTTSSSDTATAPTSTPQSAQTTRSMPQPSQDGPRNNSGAFQSQPLNAGGGGGGELENEVPQPVEEEKKSDNEADAHTSSETQQQQQFSAGQNNSAVLSQSPRETVVSHSQNEFETIPRTTGIIPAGMVASRSQNEFEIPRPTGSLPLAIAKLYKLPLVDGTSTEVDFTADQLKSLVQVYFPRNGGRIERQPSPPSVETNERPRFGLRHNRREQGPEIIHYNVVDRHNVVKRTIFVGDDGKVFRVLDEEEQAQQERTTPSSIKLGLGDFIFYSVLVSKASLHGFTTFAACVVGILAGLLLTLLILTIRGKALPALPISIFFGVSFYLPTRYVLEPFIHNMYWKEFYM